MKCSRPSQAVHAACAAGAAVLVALVAAGCGSSSPQKSSPGETTSSAPTADPTTGSTTGTTTGPARTATTPRLTPGRGTGPRSDQAHVLDSLPGSRSATCAVVGPRTDVRAGTMAAGNFQVARRKYASEAGHMEAPEVFLYVIPQRAKHLHKVTVSVDPASGPPHTVTSTSVERADVWRYFAVNLPIPGAGAYRLTMVSGPNRGCFDVTFSR
jgi:hypothetical protein